MNDISHTLAILSAMITPVVLILASGSLILTTSQRLSRSIERTRKLSDAMRNLVKQHAVTPVPDEELQVLYDQLEIASQRARLLQQAMTILYGTVFFFIATCISIAAVFLSRAVYTWLPVALGLTGIVLLFIASIILIRETRIAIVAVQNETEHLVLYFRKHLPALPRSGKIKWWRRLLRLRDQNRS